MTESIQQSAGKLKINVDGQDLPDEIDQRLSWAVVENNLNQPDHFTLIFRDNYRQILKQIGAEVGSTITVTAYSDLAPGGQQLMTGDVTALELDIDRTGSFTVMRGYDVSHRLFRGTHSETYQDMTYGDVVTKVAGRAGVPVGTVDAGGGSHPTITQNNESDWNFLSGLALEIGYQLTASDGKLHFQSHGSDPGAKALDLAVGSQILTLRAVVTAAGQVSQVTVRGWDPIQKTALESTTQAAAGSTQISVTPSDLAAKFGSKSLVGAGVPFSTQADVDAATQALAGEIAESFAELDGTARGNAAMRAGTPINISLAGDPFDGSYTLTATRHHYDPQEGYLTGFQVSGTNRRSLLALAGGTSPRGGANDHVMGVVPALVTDVNDPENLARVKLKFPWLDDKYETGWARTVQAGAGSQRGAVFLPEVNDEVLVAFDRGDWRLPYVIGGIHNGVDLPKLGSGLIDGVSGGVKRRGMVSKDGHMLLFFDESSNGGLALMTGGGLKVSLNDTSTTIKISSTGDISIEGTNDVTIKAGGSLTLQAATTATLQGESISVAGQTSVSVTAESISLG